MPFKELGGEVLWIGRADPAVLVQEDEPLIIGFNEGFDVVSQGLVMWDRSCGCRICGEGVGGPEEEFGF
jgi:hypothetical protein